jgi:hypothetical protein
LLILPIEWLSSSRGVSVSTPASFARFLLHWVLPQIQKVPVAFESGGEMRRPIHLFMPLVKNTFLSRQKFAFPAKLGQILARK